MTSEVKVFTPAQANKMLPLVKKIVDDILALGHKIRALSAEVGPHAESHPDIVKLLNQLEELFEELEALGCSYKDWNFSMGLVDFPAVIYEEEVCLCWRSDETELKYYHGLEEGYPGRKLIPKEYFKV